MTAASRLDAAFPQFSLAFKQASLSMQREAVANACAIAVSRTNLEVDEIGNALQCIREDRLPDEALINRLSLLVSNLDDLYFQIDEAGDSKAINIFSKARAASALLFALSDKSPQLNESIYEVLAAVDDPAEITDSIKFG
ncbi:hypothetical protein [Methylomonas albis]|uniref:DUF47 domain-containing protein n=1 Tax=Methylomonas albis TaxID=1854563 RepID=A0ABR9D5A9_9GAMM|nr:hypothetical protein [Methylomonas albis]MBD9357399.1 hypothetical protein [Methylomonas albis]